MFQRAAGLCRALTFIALSSAAGNVSADVFINEFHYDNLNTDSAEAVEVIAPAGTSLAGWSVVLYNGSDGRRYATLSLTGSTSNQCAGHGTVVVQAPGIQNGGPDGLALVDADGNVIQFLSYEGSFTATDGPAAGLSSQDVGVAETSSTPVGHSLQLAGSSAGGFSWQAPSASSLGACNAGQTFSGGGGGNVLGNGSSLANLSAATGATLDYVIDLPAGASALRIAISGGSGDADLYLRRGVAPTTSSYDCRPYLSGNNESCQVGSPAADRWHVQVRAYQAFSGLTLTASYTPPTGGGGSGGGSVLSRGVPLPGLSANTGQALFYTIEVPAGASGLSVASSGGTGDADLYLRFGSAPTTSSYDCRPYQSGNSETCTVASPQAGTWHVMLRAYTSFSGVSLVGDFNPASGGGGGGGIPTGYYAGVLVSSAAALRSSLHPVIDDHIKLPYTASTTDSWDVLEFADEDPLDSSRVLDIYKNVSYAKAGGGNNFYNREHTWPKSLGFPDDGAGNYPYTDLHMLMLSEINYNAARGNLPFGHCNASCSEFPTQSYAGSGGGSGSFPGNSNWSNGSVWQVWRKLKGNVARAMFYMDLRYEGGTHGGSGSAEPDLRLTDTLSLVSTTGSNASVAYMGSLSVLLQWHAEDPVDEAEGLRNDAVYSYQGNRNPFVDHPEWVACVYQSVCN
jgi:endonuclease I